MKPLIGANAQPRNTDAAVQSATGKGWREWRELIDAWPGKTRGHGAIAAHLQQAHGLGSWWAQAVTAGYEHLSGQRLPYQQADGSFAAGASRTLFADAAALRRQLLDAESRRTLFPGIATTLRSRPGTKTIRLGIDPGTAEIALAAQPGGRVKVEVSMRLPTPEGVAHWKAWWRQWLRTIGAAPRIEAPRQSPEPRRVHG